MTITGPSQLAEILRAAANAYHIYEQSLGHPDSDWPTPPVARSAELEPPTRPFLP
jgi:hypothetical protein